MTAPAADVHKNDLDDRRLAARPSHPRRTLVRTAAGCGGMRRGGSQAGGSNPTINGIPCDLGERLVFHIHAHVAIYANGQPLTVPYGIGIGKPWQVQQSTEEPFVVAGSCFYWLHTHTGDGIIHIESPVQRTFTLGDFFVIWGQPLSSSQAASATDP